MHCMTQTTSLGTHMGANKVQWASGVTLYKDCMSFCPKITFSYKWIFEWNIFQIVIKNVYSFPKLMTCSFVYHFWVNTNFWKCANAL